jgi:hypothetical protein
VNPAGLGANDCVRISGGSTRLFGQPELTQVSFEADISRIGLYAGTFGGSLYRESVFGIGLGSTVEGLGVGLSLSVMNVSIEGYGSSNAVGLNAGAGGSIGSSLGVAVLARNLNLPTIGACEDDLPVDLECGLAAMPWQTLLVCLSIRMEHGPGPSVSGGFEFDLDNSLFLRAGSNLTSREFACGLGLELNGLVFDYGLSAHDPLGLTQGISVCYTVSRR